MFCKIPLTNNGVWTCGSVWLAGPRYLWIGTVLPRGVEPVRALLCVTSASLGFVSNTPVQVFNLFGNINEIHLKYQCTKRLVLPQWNVNAITKYCIRRSPEI